jgi:hypothetical protein
MYIQLDIKEQLNSRGITTFAEREKGYLAFGGYSFPKEHFPKYDTDVFSFHFDENDNMELEEQRLSVPVMSYKKAILIGCSNNGDFFEDISFYNREELVDTKRVVFPDILSNEPEEGPKVFGRFPYIHTKTTKVDYLQPSLWINTIEWTEEMVFDHIQFGDNPSIHLFAITLIPGSVENE